MQFHRIPKLKKYDYILWVDSSFSISQNITVELLIDLLRQNSAPMIAYRHPGLKSIREEGRVAASDGRWSSTMLWGIEQPFQNITKQVNDYYNSGYTDKYFGVHWASGIFLIDMHHPKTEKFLDEFYLQTLKYTTECQISMPYAAWKTDFHPGLIVPGTVYRNPYFKHWGHSK